MTRCSLELIYNLVFDNNKNNIINELSRFKSTIQQSVS